MSNKSKEVGARLKDLRVQRGETQADISKVLGVTDAAVCQYENGQAIPSDSVKEKYARHFKRSVQFIFFR